MLLKELNYLGKIMQHSSLSALAAAAAAIGSSLCAPSVAGAQTTYKLTQVTQNSPAISAGVTGMNDEGDLVLTVIDATTLNTYLWHSGTEINIGGLTPSAFYVESGGINDLAQIVGNTFCPELGTACGFVWTLGHMKELPSPAGATAAFANYINLLGDIVGDYYDENGAPHEVLWSQGKPTVLPDSLGHALWINNRGEIVGCVAGDDGDTETTVWRHGSVSVVVHNACPNKSNDEGQIVGYTIDSRRPFLWQNGVTTILPALPGGPVSGGAGDINDWGQIVGQTGDVAVLWQHGTVSDLNSQITATDPLRPYVHLHVAYLINNLGQIVANGIDSRNPDFSQTYLLTPGN
jgi:uncharacterized membrane protein